MKINLQLEHRHGSIRGRSFSFNSKYNYPDGEYDLGIFFSSSDNRSQYILSRTNLQFDTSFLVLFKDKDEYGIRDKNDNNLEKFVKEISLNIVPIEEYSVDVGAITDQITDAVRDLFKRKGASLKIFYDMNTCPPVYTVWFIKYALENSIYHTIHFYYSEVIYEPDPSNKRYIFTEGDWHLIRIPGYYYPVDPRKKYQYYISVGFEGYKTKRVISKKEPDKVSIVFPRPGFLPLFERIAYKENKHLIRDYGRKNVQFVQAGAGDPIDVWKKMERESLEDASKYNIFYLAFGTKAHALGLALRSIHLKDKSRYLYAQPEKHRVLKFKQLGKDWIYEISDLSVSLK